MFTIAEAQEVLGLKRARIMQLIKSGELVSRKELDPLTGSKRYITLEAIEQFKHAREAKLEQPQTGKRGPKPRVPKLPD